MFKTWYRHCLSALFLAVSIGSAAAIAVESPLSEGQLADECSRSTWFACTDLGKIYLQRSRVAEAEQLFRHACDHGDERGCTMLGMRYEAAGRKPEAEDHYMKGCRRDESETSGCMRLVSLAKSGFEVDKIRVWVETQCWLGFLPACAAKSVLQLMKNDFTGFSTARLACESGSQLNCSTYKKLLQFWMIPLAITLLLSCTFLWLALRRKAQGLPNVKRSLLLIAGFHSVGTFAYFSLPVIPGLDRFELLMVMAVSTLIGWAVVLPSTIYKAGLRAKQAFNFKIPEFKLLGICLVMATGFWLLGMRVDILLLKMSVPDLIPQVGQLSPVLLILLAPSLEELFFRGLVLEGLRVSRKTWPAIVLSASLFAVFHVNPIQIPTTLAIGLIYGWIKARSGSVTYPILMHMAHNGLCWLSMQADQDFRIDTAYQSYIPFLEVSGGALFVVSAYAFIKVIKNQSASSKILQLPAPCPKDLAV